MNPKQPAQKILDFIFDQIGNKPQDTKVAEWAKACETVTISLLSTIENTKVRELALEEMNETTVDCIRRTSDVLDAIEHRELTIKEKH